MRYSTNVRPEKLNMLQQLDEQQIDFSPLKLQSIQREYGDELRNRCDALMRLQWEDNTFCFVVEAKTRFDSLQVVQSTVEQVLLPTKTPDRYPIIYLPYLSKNTISMLKDAEVSGFDLCGNLFVYIPGKIYIERIGKPNKFPSSAPIKNIYQKNSSLVSRLFLLQPTFESIMAIVRELKRRDGNLTQATVSKVCQRLEEDIIIGKRLSRTQGRKETYLIQPETMLEHLVEQYASPTVRERATFKSRASEEDLLERLINWGRASGEKIVRTGATSCTAYTVMAREEMTSYYCSNVARLLSDLKGMLEETKRFADIELIETNDQFVYFDQRDDLCASPMQSYLELMQGDKRDRQAAKMIAERLLEKIRITLKTNGG